MSGSGRRLVLDTNIWLDWLVFEDTGIAHIRQLQEAGHVEIVVDAVCEAEFAEVITRKFQRKTLDSQAQAAALAQLRRLSTRIDAQLPTPERAPARVPRPGRPEIPRARARRGSRRARHQGPRAARARAPAQEAGRPHR